MSVFPAMIKVQDGISAPRAVPSAATSRDELTQQKRVFRTYSCIL